MITNAASYLNSTYQDKNSFREEQQEPKGVSADASTQQSGASVTVDQAVIAVNEASRQQEANSSTTQQQSASPRMDTLEISEKGRTKLQESRNRAAEAEQYEAENLSEYTDAELKQMYYKGEITRQEYEDEVGKTLS